MIRSATLRWIFVAFLLSGTLSRPVLAQRDGDRVQVRFVAQTKPASLGEVVMVSEEVVSDSFTLPLHHLTEPQTAPGRQFHIAGGEPARALASVSLPAEGRDFVVLLVAGVESPYEAVVIPYRGDAFRPGDFYLHNVSRQPVLGRVGSSEFSIDPRQGRVVRPAGAREGRFYDVLLGIREANGVRPLSQSRWPVGGQTRTYVFFYHDPVRDDVSFRAVDEFVPEEE